MSLNAKILNKLNEEVNYFDYLRMTGKKDNRKNYYDYLVNVEGWDEKEAIDYVNMNWEGFEDQSKVDSGDKSLDESNDNGTDYYEFLNNLKSALINNGYSVYNKDESSFFSVSSGNRHMHIVFYLFDDVDNMIEGKDSIGLGGDTDEITVYPIYPNNSWDYETATPMNLRPEVGSETYAIFKALEDTSVQEVVDIVNKSFQASLNSDEENINESYQFGTMTEEQFDYICEKLGLLRSDASGGIIRFRGADLDSILDLIDNNLIDTSDRQNNSPSIKEMIDFAHDHNENTKNYTFDGYVVVPSRSDSRISIDGIDFDYDDEALDDVTGFLKYADELNLDNNHASAWWD